MERIVIRYGTIQYSAFVRVGRIFLIFKEKRGLEMIYEIDIHVSDDIVKQLEKAYEAWNSGVNHE